MLGHSVNYVHNSAGYTLAAAAVGRHKAHRHCRSVDCIAPPQGSPVRAARSGSDEAVTPIGRRILSRPVPERAALRLSHELYRSQGEIYMRGGTHLLSRVGMIPTLGSRGSRPLGGVRGVPEDPLFPLSRDYRTKASGAFPPETCP